jgi:hypothetical protein
MSGINLEDKQNWVCAVEAARIKYEQLPVDAKSVLNTIIDEIMRLKDELLGLTLAKGGAEICSACGGICCNNGKFHVSVLDLMACFYSSTEPPAPDFGKSPLCPYGGSDGCFMAPNFRPVTCVIFNCEQVDGLIDGDERVRLNECERQIRGKVRQAEQQLGYRVGRPLLLSFEE